MSDIFNNTYYGNTAQEWLVSLGIILFVVVLGRVVYWVFSKVIKTFTSKSENTVDDLVVDLFEEPAVFMLMVVGIWFAFSLLKLPAGFTAAIDNSIHIIVAILVGWLLVRLADAVFEFTLVPWATKTDNDLDDQLMPILRKGIRTLIWVMALIIGLNNAGYNVGAILAGLGIGGLAMAMAAKDTVSNIFGGFTIFADKPFRLGDRIKVKGYDGSVVEIGVRSTRLRTLEGRIVTIPNSTFTDVPVENVTVEPSRKVAINLGLTYDTTADQMDQAIAILQSIIENNENTEENMYFMFSGFGDFSMNIGGAYYIKSGCSIAGTQTDVNMQILRQFNANKLEFAFPTQTLYNIEAKNG